MQSKQRFITFEGIEGAGKSTQIKILHHHLIGSGKKCLMTREPGGTAFADQLRGLLASTDTQIGDVSELLLMFASRASHVQEIILPKLSEDYWVLCDRFVDASYAYQGFGRGVDIKTISYLEKITCANLVPDMTILLDLPVDIMLSRLSKRASGHDRIEQESIDFFNRVREGYLQRAAMYSDRYLIVDAQMSEYEVTNYINLAIESRFNAK